MIDRQKFDTYYRTFPHAVVKEIIDDFLLQIPERMERIREAVISSDWQTLKKEVHQLKGSASFFFDPELNASFFRMEENIREKNMAGLKAEYPAFQQFIRSLKKELTEHLQSLTV